jgi:hypothetical protein
VFSSPEGGHNSALLYGQLTTEPVPEPASLLLFGGALTAVAVRMRRAHARPPVAGRHPEACPPRGAGASFAPWDACRFPSALTQLLWLFVLSGVVACVRVDRYA